MDPIVYYYLVSASTCALSFVLFWLTVPRVSRRLFPKYSNLTTSDQITWCCRGDSVLVRTSCAVVLGYMISDSVFLMVYDDQLKQRVLLFHHLITAYAYYYVVMQGLLPYYANFRLVAEFSTPFLRMWWFLKTLGYGLDHWLSRTNLLVMTVVFAVVRICAVPIFWYKVYSSYGSRDFVELGLVRFTMIGTCILLDVLNALWFFKMCSMLKKSFEKKKTE